MGTYADIINKRKKDWNCSSLMDGAHAARGSKLPFSSPLLNYSTYGGVPRGQITEFFGNPSGGKSTTATDICKNAHRIFKEEYESQISSLRERAIKDKVANAELEELEERGVKKVLYIDLEHSFDGDWAHKLGIESDAIDIMQPPDVVAEDLLQTVQELIETGELGLVVLDSVPSLTTRQELEKKYGERTVASLAGLLTIFCRKLVPLLKRYDTTFIFINQIRDNMDNPYVVNTPGGKALKFYCSLRIEFKIGTPVDFLGNELPSNAENPAGHIITAKIVKQKSAPWDRKNASYYLMAQSGIEIEMDFAQLAVKKYGIIRKAGAWFTVCDPYTGEVLTDEKGLPVKLNGMSKVLDFLKLNPDYFKKVQDYIIADISGEDLTAQDSSESDDSEGVNEYEEYSASATDYEGINVE